MEDFYADFDEFQFKEFQFAIFRKFHEKTPSNFRKSIASAMCSAAIFCEDSMSAIVRAIL